MSKVSNTVRKGNWLPPCGHVLQQSSFVEGYLEITSANLF